jgi:5-methylcytosine-specific restriction endonuclease McrA
MKHCKNCKKEICDRARYCSDYECRIARDKERYYLEKNDKIKYKKLREINKKASEKKRFGISRKVILEKFDNQCGYCGNTKHLVIHHIDGKGRSVKKANNELSNLIPCCHSCHSKLHNLGGSHKK